MPPWWILCGNLILPMAIDYVYFYSIEFAKLIIRYLVLDLRRTFHPGTPIRDCRLLTPPKGTAFPLTSCSGRSDTRRLPGGSFQFFRFLRNRSLDASTKIAADIFAAIRKRAVERNHQRLPHLTQPGRRPWLSSYSVFTGSPHGRSCPMGEPKPLNSFAIERLWFPWKMIENYKIS